MREREILSHVHTHTHTHTHTYIHTHTHIHTYTHTHAFMGKAIELDPDNESYRANLKTVEDQFRGGTSAADGPPSGEGGAPNGGSGADQQGGANPFGGE